MGPGIERVRQALHTCIRQDVKKGNGSEISVHDVRKEKTRRIRTASWVGICIVYVLLPTINMVVRIDVYTALVLDEGRISEPNPRGVGLTCVSMTDD